MAAGRRQPVAYINSSAGGAHARKYKTPPSSGLQQSAKTKLKINKKHRAWLLRQDSCPLGVLWNYYGDAGRGDTQEEMDAYNEFNTYGEFMDNPVAPWFANGDDENGGPDASTYFMG